MEILLTINRTFTAFRRQIGSEENYQHVLGLGKH